MNYLSICSGIEAASVAFKPLGWEALAFSEIEAFPRAVLAHHYPDVPCHGDFTELKTQPWIVDADLLCGGTPCQAFSVAGLRNSLSDARGNLSLEFILLADAIDHLRSTAGREPAYVLWENVPGVLSTSDNAFGAFLGGLCGRDTAIPQPADGWPSAGVVDGPTRVAAWRILDAQHFGLAQRRKRVFVLARGGAGRWAAADALLPIIESMCWHPAPSRSKGQGVAAAITAGAPNGGPAHGARSGSAKEGNLIPQVAGTMKANNGGGGWTNSADHAAGSYMVPVAIQGNMIGRADDAGPAGSGHDDSGAMFTLTKTDVHGVAVPMLLRMREGKEGGGKGPLVSNDQSLTLATANDQVLAYNVQSANSCAMQGDGDALAAIPTDMARALDSAGFTANQGGTVALGPQMMVRRLVPAECEKLQGFPVGYTNVPWRGKPEAPDGPRYKALGNSWAVPCAHWIGRRIQQVEEIIATTLPS